MVVKDNILYRVCFDHDGHRLQPVVPNALKCKVLTVLHDDGHRLQPVVPNTLKCKVLTVLDHDPTGGHLGVSKTLEQLRTRFYWFGLRKDVESW